MNVEDLLQKIDDLRKLDDDELAALEDDVAGALLRVRFQRELGQLQDVSLLRKMRRQLARIKTIRRQRELGNEGRHHE